VTFAISEKDEIMGCLALMDCKFAGRAQLSRSD
jgi:hypothetical protein